MKKKPQSKNGGPAVAAVAKGPRPPAYDIRPDRYQWHFRLIPPRIVKAGRSIPNPFLDTAIYVVHGIGEQRYAQTAAELRLGFEDAVERVEPGNWSSATADRWIVPQPFISDGFWGDYHKIEEMEPALWNRFTQGEKDFFGIVWSKRALSLSHTFKWLLRSGVCLILKSRGIARLYYLYLVPLLWLVVALGLPFAKTRQFITGYLSDIRLYLEPEGDLEHAIVQRIDHMVGARYLRLLGFDWDLNELPKHERMYIFKNQPQRFQRVVWVAHSLGTVISYNVIGDILRRCAEVPASDAKRRRNANIVEQSLAAFVTLGSPLDKVRFLFPHALRDWPKRYLPGESQSLWKRQPRFWENFHYTSDPVSGSLDLFRHPDPQKNVSLVRNLHSKGFRIPGMSHLDYWDDDSVLTRVLHLAFAPFVRELPLKTRSPFGQALALLLVSVFWVLALLAAVVILGWWVGEQFGLWSLISRFWQ